MQWGICGSSPYSLSCGKFLWVFLLQAFGIQWVLPSAVTELLFCWNQWLGKHDLDIWNLIPGCLMWTVWMERNRWSFEDSEKSGWVNRPVPEKSF